MKTDFQQVADSIGAMTCVMSVGKLPDGSCGEIRIVTGNRSYIDSIENPPGDMHMLSEKFIPNSLYTRYLNRDLNFEDYCYRAAVQKRCLHSYAHPDRYDIWFNMTFLPLWPDEGNLCFCTYTMEISFEPSSERISNISGDIASAVLETAIALRGAKDIKQALGNTVKDIKKLCQSESCCVLLVDDEKKSCEILGHSRSEESKIRVKNEQDNNAFYAVASTWKDTIHGSNCLIAKDDREMQVVADRNPVWYRSLRESGVRTIALFPLKSRNDHFGYIWAANFHPEQSTRVKEILELTSFVLGSEIGNYLMVNQLKEMSSRDMLTGVMNRNKMNTDVDALCSLSEAEAKPVGVLFTDLNGLKRINDSQGHSAGDNLLRSAAHALCTLFDARSIYRAGGDEFVVILPGTRQAELEEKADALRRTSENYQALSFSIGCCASEDCREIRSALMTADERMYEDKKKYYGRR